MSSLFQPFGAVQESGTPYAGTTAPEIGPSASTVDSGIHFTGAAGGVLLFKLKVPGGMIIGAMVAVAALNIGYAGAICRRRHAP